MSFETTLRQYIYRHIIREQRVPKVAEMAATLSCSVRRVLDGLKRLAETHAFVLQEDGELWRAVPFSAVPTPFPVQIGKSRWWGNCVWDALGIPAMLAKNARLDASCGCCNYEMVLEVRKGKLKGPKGVIHIAVPARNWYDDIVFT